MDVAVSSCRDTRENSAGTAAAAPPLRPLVVETPLAPRSQNERARVHAELSRIATTSVCESVRQNGHRFYVVDVAFKLNAPRVAKGEQPPRDTRPSAPPIELRAAAMRVQWRFADFANLRDEMYYHALAGHRHHKRPCAFCAGVTDALSRAPPLPRLHQLMFGDRKTVCQGLEAFVVLALRLAVSIKAHREFCCDGQRLIPRLVSQFLLGPERWEERLASSASRRRASVSARASLLAFS